MLHLLDAVVKSEAEDIDGNEQVSTFEPAVKCVDLSKDAWYVCARMEYIIVSALLTNLIPLSEVEVKS